MTRRLRLRDRLLGLLFFLAAEAWARLDDQAGR